MLGRFYQQNKRLIYVAGAGAGAGAGYLWYTQHATRPKETNKASSLEPVIQKSYTPSYDIAAKIEQTRKKLPEEEDHPHINALKKDIREIKDSVKEKAHQLREKATTDSTRIYVDKLNLPKDIRQKIIESVEADLRTISDDDWVFSERISEGEKNKRLFESTKGAVDKARDKIARSEAERLRKEAEATTRNATEGFKRGMKETGQEIKEKLAGKKDQVVGAAEITAENLKDTAGDMKEKLAGKKDQMVGAVETRVKSPQTRTINEYMENLKGKKDYLVGAMETRFKDLLGYTQPPETSPPRDINETTETLKGKRDQAVGAVETRAKDMLGYTSGPNPEPTRDINETAEKLKGKIDHAKGAIETRAKDAFGYSYETPDSLRHPVDVRRDVLGRPIYEIPTTEDEYRRIGRKIRDRETDIKHGASYVSGKVEEAATSAKQSLRTTAKVAEQEAKNVLGYVEEKADHTKEKAKRTLDKTEQKAKELGSSVKETAVATKDILEDKTKKAMEVTGEKLKELSREVSEKASDLKDSAIDSSIKLKDKSAEVAKAVTEDTIYISHVVGDKAKQGYEAVKEPIVETYEKEKDVVWQKVSDVRDRAALEKEYADRTQGTYKEQANELYNKLYTEATEKASKVPETVKDVTEDVALSTAHKMKDTADYTASKAANVTKKVVPPVKEAYDQTKETVYDKVKEARDKAADLKRQKEVEESIRGNYIIDRMPDKTVHASEEFASPDATDEVINNP